MKSFTLISDQTVTGIPVVDTGEELVNISPSPKLVVSSKRAAIYEGFTLLRTTVADKLTEAAELLPAGCSILFEEGHRPLPVQKKIFDDYYARLKVRHPEWSHERIHVECTKYVAVPSGSPPHSTGAALDVSLADESGRELELGSISDDTPDENGDRNFTYSRDISDAAKNNRRLLIDAMERVGFVNYPAEWWHWSYGDQYWAFANSRQNAIYGPREMPTLMANLTLDYRDRSKGMPSSDGESPP